MESKIEKLSWKPKLVGNRFCSSACGGGCTKAQYETVKALGKQIAKQLGTGWHSQVSENLRWYVKVVSKCGRIKVHPLSDTTYRNFIAYIGEPEFPGGYWCEYGKTPKEAVNATIRSAKSDIAKIQARIKGLQEFKV